MINKKKVVFEFLQDSDRQMLSRNLELLKKVKNLDYVLINSKVALNSELSKLIEYEKPLIIQIISHGNCDGFGLNLQEYINYIDIVETLKRINMATNNQLILNLMTVCCSVYQLALFNRMEDRIFNTLIGCTRGAFVNGSIIHSVDLYNSSIQNIYKSIDDFNFRLNDDYSINKFETWSYMIKQ